MAYQSLYRRYRPGKFSEIAGQEHVVAALRNAVRDDRTGHAYLFSGPRGTGKTSTARIMAKALNCTRLGDDGEPCGECDSCLAFASGTSYDLHELDAASNNGVEAVRDLIGKVALGSPGRTKVYVLDEVHMLTPGAENALLKTLEEPPEHVKFVLATTEPHKVVPTIRSRTQHLHFELLPAETVSRYVRWVADDAGLDVDDDVIAHVVREGGGSMRDTLSALDQVVAAGGVHGDLDAVIGIVEAIATVDAAAAMVSVEGALRSGRDPRVIGESVLARLRDAFLAVIGADLSHLPDHDREVAEAVADRAGAPRLTRALETLGSALVDMRQAPDPRIDLEVSLLRLTRPDLDTSAAALIERIERLERGGEASDAAEAPEPSPSPSPSVADTARQALAATPPASTPEVKPSLGALRARADGAPAAAATSSPEAAPASEPAASPPAGVAFAEPVDIAALWEAVVLPALSKRARARFQGGHFVDSNADRATFALPNEMHRDRCTEVRPEVDGILERHVGRRVRFDLVVADAEPVAPATAADPSTAAASGDETIDISNIDHLVDADVEPQSELTRLTEIFPGAEVVEPDTT